jgi:hypothetical protein
MDPDTALRSRLEKQPTDLRRHHHYMRDGTLDPFSAKTDEMANVIGLKRRRPNKKNTDTLRRRPRQPPGGTYDSSPAIYRRLRDHMRPASRRDARIPSREESQRYRSSKPIPCFFMRFLVLKTQ